MSPMPIIVRRRYDPGRLEAVSRSLTGKTRCPECSALNPANQKYCDSCGSALYEEWRTDSPPSKAGLMGLLVAPEERERIERLQASDEEPEPEYSPLVMRPPPAIVPIRCRRCHADNPPDNSFCGKCGARLDARRRKTGSAPSRRSDFEKPPYYD